MPGTRIGVALLGPSAEQFKLIDYLGQGAFGEVYRAIGATSGRIVAVKLVPLDALDDPASQTALLNEIQLTSQIVHPNVVQVFHVDTGSSPVGPYLVMEYVSGGTLAGLLRTQLNSRAAIPLARAREMMIDIAQGARAINERLIHRDIKPDNILLDGAHLKISDFGISKVVDEQTRTRTFKGGQAVAYMAPEGWEGQTNTFKLDVYSVGLVYYQILTLEHPLRSAVPDAGDWRAWEKAHLYTACPDVRRLRPEVDSAIAQLASRMVSKRPQDRPDWQEVLAILSSSDGPAPAPDPIAGTIEIALTRQQQVEARRLEERQLAEKQARKTELYQYSFGQLADKFDAIVAEFNARYQYGKIAVQHDGPTGRRYTLPAGEKITLRLFPSCETDMIITGGTLVGGGHISVEGSISGNLLLVRDGPDDLYGRWLGCFLRFSALVDPSRFVGRWGITSKWVSPFGLQSDTDFYEQMRYSSGTMHALEYELRTDTDAFLRDVLDTALHG